MDEQTNDAPVIETQEEVEDTDLEQEDGDLTDDTTGDELTLEEQLTHAKEIGKNQKIRAEKAEKKLKDVSKGVVENPPAPEKKETPKTSDSPLTREEMTLVAQGMDEDDLSDAAMIAEREGITSKEATKTPQFVALKKVRDDVKEEENASLPATRGSRSAKKVDFNTPNLSAEQHKDLFKQKMG